MSKVLTNSPHPENNFLSGNSDMARLILSKDWSATPLGPIDRWPQSLRTTVSLCLASNFPINILWGPEHTQIYNDGYRTVCGDKHPTHSSWPRASSTGACPRCDAATRA